MTNVQDMEPDLQGGDEAVHRRAVKRVVLDTSLFVNPDVRTSLGATPAQAHDTFVYLADRIPMLEFYIPPSHLQSFSTSSTRKSLTPHPSRLTFVRHASC